MHNSFTLNSLTTQYTYTMIYENNSHLFIGTIDYSNNIVLPFTYAGFLYISWQTLRY